MAITIQNNPETYHPAYQPMWFSVTSTSYTQENFKFLCDLYVTDGYGTNHGKVCQLKFQPVPGKNYGKINIAGVLKSYLDFNPRHDYLNTEILESSGHILYYEAKFGEEYGPSSGTTQYPNLANISGYSWNGSPSYINHIFNSSTIYSTINPQKFLSTLRNISFDKAKCLSTDEEDYCAFINGTNGVNGVKITTYDSGKNQLDYGIVQNKYLPASIGNRFLHFACGPFNINRITLSEWLVQPGTDPMIVSGVKYYSIELVNNSNNVISDALFYELSDKCYRDTVFDFQFINALGAYECFRFTGAYQINSEINKSEYKKVIGSWDDSNADWIDSYQNRGKANYSTIIRNRYKVYSNWITEDESRWLLDLISSPDVLVRWPYSISESEIKYYWIPVQIINTTYVTKRESSDVLFNIEMEWEFTNNDYRQQW